jgi:beta-lactamase superfamily II metal-dependent hydrolase
MIVPALRGINPNLKRKELAVLRAILWACVVTVVLMGVPAAQGQEPRTLDIYFLDMVGGASTLVVTPLGESILIDTGSLRPEHRDADRILRACRDAGLKQIDYLVTTHFHSDHFGAILEASQRIPVKCFIDKGARAPAGDGDNKWSKELYALYEQATKGDAQTIRAGDDIPLKNDPTGKLPKLTLHCVAAEKKVEGFEGDIDAPVDGFEMKPPDHTDNARSIALLLTYGRFKFFAGGDITWNVEQHLAHPVNRIGPVDLYQVTHHGLDLSNNPLLLKALSPTVAVAMNGPRKGIQPRAFKDLTTLPGLQGLYQIHYNTDRDGEYNTASGLIANPKDSPDRGEFIKVVVDGPKGVFTVRIGANGPPQEFSIQQAPPDLSQCTRIEMKWLKPVLEQACSIPDDGDLLNDAESKYLESLRPTVLDDPERIRAFAGSFGRGRHRGITGGVPRVDPYVAVDCYRDGRHQESFTAYDRGLIILQGRWFEYGDGFPGLWALAPTAKTPELRPFIVRADCAEQASQLGTYFSVQQLDKKEHTNPARWCDAIVQDDLADGGVRTKEEAMSQFRCPAAGEGRCHYALNPDCRWNSAADTVLLFETKAGWNQHGGPESFTIDHHDPKGGCVVLNDGKVRFIRSEEELRQLRWKQRMQPW